VDVLLHCFADSIGAHGAMLMERRKNPGAAVLATWARNGRPAPGTWTSDGLLAHAFDGRGPWVESDPPVEGGGHRVSAAPVSSPTGVIGAIYATFEPPSRATRDQLVWTTECYARLAALCMSGEELTLPAALGNGGYDPLTGCLTYAASMEVLRAEVQRTQRRGHRLSACMIDLDGFKRVNDEHGHLEGNRVLGVVGGALLSAARRYDAVGRFGGDEFMVVLPETGGADGERIAKRFLACLRAAIETAPPDSIDASVGLMEWDGESSPLQLLDGADLMMREAKGAGGGRVRWQRSAPETDGLTELSRHMYGSFRASGSEEGDRLR
jgi:diguanylate cyclase (GGDEF)-like protein